MKKTIAFCMLALLLAQAGKALAQTGTTQIWFQHDDYVDMNGDGQHEFVPDMLARWYNHDQWRRALDHTDVYSIHENLFKIGAPQGMGAKFVRLLKDHFGDMDTTSLYVAYLKLILPVLHAHGVELQIHTVGSKGDFVPWNMYGTANGTDSIAYPKNNKGLDLIKNTLKLINGVCDSLFTDGYRVTQVKLQSVLSGIWRRGLQNNVYVALEYMKAIQEVYPEMKFYLGDALLQRRDYDKKKTWRQAYKAMHETMMNDERGYSHLNFQGIRLEFDKHWADSVQFENAPGWHALADSGAFDLIKSLGWQVGIEHNNPYAHDAWEYEKVVLRTAEKSQELNLHWDFAVVHTDEAGGKGHGYPYDVAPEDRGPDEPPTFTSVLNKVFDFYNNITSINTSPLPQGFRLFQNYPNPFNPSTTIQFSLQEKHHVRLAVFDLRGRQVAVLLDADVRPGKHTVPFDAAGLVSGTYFIRLQTERATQVRKALLIR